MSERPLSLELAWKQLVCTCVCGTFSEWGVVWGGPGGPQKDFLGSL